MARIKYGGLITDISSSVGSTTMQRGQFGSIMRNKPRQKRNATVSQSSIRAMLAQCHYSWRNMSDGLREEWRRYIDFTSPVIRRDNAILLTGHALFIKWNMLRLIQGYTIVTALTYPDIPDFPLYESLSVGSPGVHTLTVSHTVAGLDISAIIKASRPRPASWKFRESGLITLREAEFSTTTCDIYTEYVAYLNTSLSVGDVIHLQMQWFMKTAPIISQRYNTIVTTSA